MLRYDPGQTPNAAQWLALDEQDRIDLAANYHRVERIKLPNAKMHAIVHSIVENQIALNHEPVVRAMARLTAQGLSRHDAVHAIGAVLAHYMFDAFQGASDDGPPMLSYHAAVERLTAAEWLRG